MLIRERLLLKQTAESEGGQTDGLLAKFFLERGYAIEDMTTRMVASETATSPATVVRFCKSLGMDGFNDFKRSYLAELSYFDEGTGEINPNLPFSEDDNLRAIALKIGHLHEEAIEDTLELLRYDDLRLAQRMLVRAKTIHVFSAGTSMNQAESFREKMLKIGTIVSIPNNLNYQTYEADCLGPDDLALVISYSGETKSMVAIARHCHESGVPVLALTSVGENAVASYADCRLSIATRERLFETIGDYSTHASVNLLLDILYSLYFKASYRENYERKLARTRHHEEMRSSTSSVLMPRAPTQE